jgi:signal transduction histidine kinase
VENALVYAGDAPPQIEVSGRREEGGVHLVIRDQGPGIPADAQDRIFQLFKQLDPHGVGKQGAGMGLALCKRIAERHGGRMWVESTLGEGAAFHVTLQLSPDAES